MISDEEKDQVRAVSDLVAIVQETVELKPRGHEFWGCCPFHGEKTPSFHIIPATQVWHCFGCGEGGDVFTYIMKRENLSFPESIRYLADRAGIELHDTGAQRDRGTKRARIYDLCAETAQFYHTMLMRGKDSRPREYFASRGMGGDVCRRYCLGFAPGRNTLVSHLSQAGFTPQEMIDANVAVSRGRGQLADRFYDRVMFPIFDEQGHNIAFGGRIIADEDEAKYINSSDTPIYKKGEHLYGLAQARKGITVKGRALLTEGYMDVLTLHQFGYDNAVGVLGTALTPDQIKRLSGFTSQLTLLFDGDRAGRKAALRSCEMLLTRGLACTVVLMPEGEDIDSLLRTQGVEAFEALQAQAPDGLRFCLDVLRALAPRETVEWAKNFLRHVEVPELVSPYVSRLATHLQLSEAELRQGLADSRRPGPDGQAARPGRARQNMRDRQIMMYAVRYPDRLDALRDLGADLALQSDIARQLWDKLEEWGPDEAPYHLDQREKNFWSFCRGAEAAPRDGGDRELAALRHDLDAYYAATQRQSVTAALRQNTGTGDFAADLEYLRALQETLEQGHEQS